MPYCLVLAWILLATQTSDPAPATQPTSQAAPRTPVQADIYRQLLREQERPTRILPTDPSAQLEPESAAGMSPSGLRLDGTMLVDRPGRLVRTDDRSLFRFSSSGADEFPATLEFNKNGLLEAMERESELDRGEFYITAVVSTYRGSNYLTLLKYRRQVSNGNLSP